MCLGLFSGTAANWHRNSVSIVLGSLVQGGCIPICSGWSLAQASSYSGIFYKNIIWPVPKTCQWLLQECNNIDGGVPVPGNVHLHYLIY